MSTINIPLPVSQQRPSSSPYGGYPMPAGSTGPSGWGSGPDASGNNGQSDTMISAENRAPGGGGTPTDLGALPTNQNPWGGSSYRGGGGGGSSTTPGLDNASFQTMLGLLQGSRPQAGVWNNVDLPDWQQREYMPWDDTAWTTASGQVSDQIAAGRASGMADFDVAQAQLDTYENPYGNVRTTNPGTTDSMQRMLQGQGGGMGAADETAAEGRYLDAGFGYTQNLMAGAADQRQAGNQRALVGDRRHFNETLSGEERVMQMQITASMNKAKADYEKNKWMYGEEQARYIFENERDEILMNAQGKQGMQDSNLQSQNDWQQGILSPIMEMVLAGRDSAGKQGLNLGDLAALFPQEG